MLSREALQLLELMPVWKPRAGQGSDAGLALTGLGVAGIFVACPGDAADSTRFAQIGRAAVAAGWPSGLASDLVQAHPSDLSALNDRLNELDPRWLVVFGQELGSAIAKAYPRLQGRILAFEPLGPLFSNPTMKAQLWDAICRVLRND